MNQSMLSGVAKIFPLHLHDMVEELWDYKQLAQALSRFWIYLSPVMLTGGPPLACIEAFMAGMPVIIHDPYNHLSGFISGEHCFFVNSDKEAVFAAQALWSSQALRKRIGDAGRERAKIVFNIDRFVAGWQEVAA